MARFRFKKKISIGRVVAKIASTILALWVGGLVITKVVVAANKTSGPFLAGFKLLGMNTMASGCDDAATECLNGTINTGGVLSVVGIVGMASIIMEFVEIKM